MTRDEEITVACYKYSGNYMGVDPCQEDVFIAGAKWADEHPLQDYKSFRAETDQIIMKLQSQLAVAVEVLKWIINSGDGIHDGTKAKQALAKIEGLNK